MKCYNLKVCAHGDAEMAAFVRLCGIISGLGRHGASRDITVSVDGDGTGRMRFFDPVEDVEIELPNFNADDKEWLKVSIGE